MLINKESLIIDGVKMAQYLTKAKFGYHKIWGKDTGRSLSGDNSGTLKGIYPKITMTFRKLNDEEVGIILSLFNKAENKVTFYNPDLKKKINNMSCYSNDQEYDQENFGKIEGYSSAVISNKKKGVLSMRNVTDNFKFDIRTYGRQLDVIVNADNEDISEKMNYIKPSFNTDLFKTVMHKIEIDSSVYVPEKTVLNIKIGVKVNKENYEYIEFKHYIVHSCEREEDTLSYKIIAYTKMKDAMIDYDLKLTEKITVRNYLIRIFQRLGWNTSNIPATFINSEKLIDPTLHTGIDYTFRDALDEITTISCSFILFDGENPKILYLTDTNENIDESYLDEDNITIGNKYMINSLVFSRAEESDNIYRKDDTSIAENGLHEFKIKDCQLLSTNDRDIYIDDMFNYLKTLEFYIFDVQSNGILFLEACDIFNLVLSGKTYPVILLNNEISIEDGIAEALYLDEPKESETEYKYADTTDKRINQTYILVDKQNQKITQLASQTTKYEEKITQVEQDIDSIKQSVSDVANYKRKTEGATEVHLTEASKTEALHFDCRGNKEYNNYLFPCGTLFPSEIYPNQEVI